MVKLELGKLETRRTKETGETGETRETRGTPGICLPIINRAIREIKIPKEWKENTGKYSVQIQKFQIQKIKIIRSE